MSLTGQHIANHFKLICSEYGWPETLVSENGPCYTSEIFTNLMVEYNVNHITSSPHYPQSNVLAEKYVQIVKNLFHKAKEEGKDLYQCLMIYQNTPLSNTLQSPMQILTNRSARSSLPMSNTARQEKCLNCKDLRAQCKNEHLPTHDIHIGQDFSEVLDCYHMYITNCCIIISFSFKNCSLSQLILLCTVYIYISYILHPRQRGLCCHGQMGISR